MPELPDIEVYVAALRSRVVPGPLDRVRLFNPFLLRSAQPPIEAAHGRQVRGVRRLGKRIVFDLDGGLHLALHLMIAGRLQWHTLGGDAGDRGQGRAGLAALDFAGGTLVVTEAGSKRRASLYLAEGDAALAALDRGGLEVLGASSEEFAAALRRGNHTLKRALTDPRILSGIGNSYSDEILHRARLSPVTLTSRLDDDQLERLRLATVATLAEWTAKLGAETGAGFPRKVTAFRPGMRVHGRYQQPCPDCAAPVQRIVHAANESNYCPACQTGGRLLADRALSRLLGRDWPRSLEDLEEHMERRRG